MSRPGTQLKFNLMYATGIDWMESAVRELASNASLAGIKIIPTAAPFDDVFNATFDKCRVQYAEILHLAAGGLGKLDLLARLPADR